MTTNYPEAISELLKIFQKDLNSYVFLNLKSNPNIIQFLVQLSLNSNLSSIQKFISQQYFFTASLIFKAFFDKKLKETESKVESIEKKESTQENYGKENIIHELIKEINQNDQNAKMKAMFNLGKQDLRNHKEAIDLFIKLLYDSEWDIRSIAQDSISKQNLKGNKEILNSLIKIKTIRSKLADILLKLDKSSVNKLIYALNDSNKIVQINAAETIFKFEKQNKQAIDTLVKLLNNEDVGVRASEILAKQELKDKDAVNVLTKTLLYDKIPRRKAIDSLRKFDKDCKEAFKMLVEALNNKDKYIRTKAVDMLSKQDFKDNPEILEALLKSLNDQEAEIRKKKFRKFWY